MYITASTYGGMDWHDSRTIYEQLKGSGSYDIREDKVPEAIADDIAKDFPYVEDIREKILQALSEKSNLHFMIKSGEKEVWGTCTIRKAHVMKMTGGSIMKPKPTLTAKSRH